MPRMRAILLLTLLTLGCRAIAQEEKARSPDHVGDKVLIVRTPIGAGSGFIADFDGKSYIVTNQHVIAGARADQIQFITSNGEKLSAQSAEITPGNIDLIRFRLTEERDRFKIATSTPEPDEKVTAIGNSLGAGITTYNRGKVIGVGPTEIETDCEFVKGNSGGALINAAGEVLGVPTRILYGMEDRSTEGTRYAKSRRISTRLLPNQPWLPVSDWQKYASLGAILGRAELIDWEFCKAVDVIAGREKPSNFSPENPLIIQAIDAHLRLRDKINKLEGQSVTAGELNRNNNILAATYRVSNQKLRDALAPVLREVSSAKVPEDWGWIAASMEAAEKRLNELSSVAAEGAKSRPKFMGFTE